MQSDKVQQEMDWILFDIGTEFEADSQALFPKLTKKKKEKLTLSKMQRFDENLANNSYF